MGTIKIAVGGKPMFSWDGDESAVNTILNAFPKGARSVGMSPQELANNCIAHLSSGSLLARDRVGQEMQMMGVIWRILESKTNNAEHPGKIGEYASAIDFEVDFELTDRGFTAQVSKFRKASNLRNGSNISALSAIGGVGTQQASGS